jgi:hypothetical protein
MPRFLLMLAIAVTLVLSAATQAQTPQPLRWELVPGLVIDGFKMYVEVNSISREQSDNLDVAAGSFLLVPEDDGLQFKNKDGQVITALSIVRLMGVDCKNGIAIPVQDKYFDTKTPGVESKPVGGIDYKNPKPIDIRPRSSVLYRTLCPNFST